jgi:L-asparaginase / beta-aspartyl-peptidase
MLSLVGGRAMRAAQHSARPAIGLWRAFAARRDVRAAASNAVAAVTAAVRALDDDPLFNAGRGAVFTRAGTQEMDAAVMEGRERHAGAVRHSLI